MPLEQLPHSSKRGTRIHSEPPRAGQAKRRDHEGPQQDPQGPPTKAEDLALDGAGGQKTEGARQALLRKHIKDTVSEETKLPASRIGARGQAQRFLGGGLLRRAWIVRGPSDSTRASKCSPAMYLRAYLVGSAWRRQQVPI